ncbi:MAG: hypothetical protein K2L60_10685, partial [Bacteroides sp.]|nr:hypothetical protein [Bacteroides sp.]
MNKLRYILSTGLRGVGIAVVFAMPLVSNPMLPAGETAGQWVEFDRDALVAAVCIVLGLSVSWRWAAGKRALSVADAVGGALMLTGGVQALLGLLQLYGYAASHHSLYAMTGSFFNPGPYSGYLAMALPVCLHQWLTGGSVGKR